MHHAIQSFLSTPASRFLLTGAAVIACAAGLTPGCASDPAASGGHAGRAAETGQGGEAAEQGIDLRDLAPTVNTTLLQAIHAALAARPGNAVKAELDGDVEDGRRAVVFEVAILDDHGSMYDVSVDPQSGKVLYVTSEDDADELADLRAAWTAAGPEPLRLGGLLERAIALQADATAVKIGFAGPKSPGTAKVKLVRGGEFVKATLDARTGAPQ